MTDEQAKICKVILKEKYFKKVLEKCELNDYDALYNAFGVKNVDFSDNNFDEKTVVFLQGEILSEYQSRKRTSANNFITWGISVLALVISILALLKP